MARGVVTAALGQGSCTGREAGLDSCVLLDPVGESVFAILDDGLGCLVAIVSIAGLAGSDWGVVNKLEQVLAEACNDGHLLAVLAKSIELVRESSLQLFASDVGQLGLGNERLGLSTDKLLLEHDNLWAVGLLVLELSDLVGDLLLAVSAWLNGCLDVADALDGDSVLVVAVDELVFQLTNLVDEHTELVGDIGNVVVAALTPDRQLLLCVLARCAPLDIAFLITYCNLHALSSDQLHGAHDVLLHLHQLRELLREVWAEGTDMDGLSEGVA